LVSAASWLPGWSYRIPIGIDGNAENLTDYQIKVTLQGTNPLSSDYIDFDKILTNGNDVIFTDSDGITEINFWIEEWDDVTENATIWVKVPSIPQEGTKTIYIYYGNLNAATTSNGTATFLLFDDFSGAVDGLWHKYLRNPVLDVVDSTWESHHIGDPWVIYDNGTYHMWYYGVDTPGNARVGYANSTDGITWNKYDGNPILTNGPPGSYDAVHAHKPSVVFKDGTYYMYYSALGSNGGTIALATSTSPIGPWTKYSGNPVLSPTETWENNTLDCPSVMYDSDEDIWKMWYSSGVRNHEPIYWNYATSRDGYNWTKYSGNPIASPPNDNSWLNGGLGGTDVLKINGTYHMYYNAFDKGGGSKVGYTNSSDGIIWNPEASDLILGPSNPGSWDSVSVYRPNAQFVDGQWVLWYNARPFGTTERIGYANKIRIDPNKWSDDGNYAIENGRITIKKGFGSIYSSKNWHGIAMSSTGQYQAAVVYGGQIYISFDYGNTWAIKDSGRDWAGIAMSSTGQYQTAVVYGGQIYISSDYGNNWTAKSSATRWHGIAMSSTGQYQTAVVYGGQIYISSDYGNNWTAKDNATGWYGIAMSSTGQYQTALVCRGPIYISSDYGNTWAIKAHSARNWYGIAMSSSGQYQTAVVYEGQIYISSDHGNNWTAKDSARNWIGAAMSSTGQYQTAVVYGGQIYISSDYGDNWTAKDSARDWIEAAMSSTGQYQTAVISGGQIYISSDYGNNWTAKGGPITDYLLTSTDSFILPLAIEAKAKVGSDWDNGLGWNFAVFWGSLWRSEGYLGGHYKSDIFDYSSLERFSNGIQTDSYETTECIGADTWYHLSLLINSSNQYYKVNDSIKANLTTTPSEDPGKVTLIVSKIPGDTNTYTTYFDWVFIRNYTSPEPSVNLSSSVEIVVDFDHDGDVDAEDLHNIADQWLNPPGIPSADIAPPPSGDGIVNFLDFAEFAKYWL